MKHTIGYCRLLGRYKQAMCGTILCLLLGCESRTVFSQQYAFTSGIWPSDSVLTFEFLAQKSETYALLHTVYYRESFPYHNLYVQYKLYQPPNHLLQEDVRHVSLFDKSSGAPLGSGSTGLFWKKDTLCVRTFSETAYHTIEMSQFMRLDSLRGVENVGISIEKVMDE